jgi:hypothetical protein
MIDPKLGSRTNTDNVAITGTWSQNAVGEHSQIDLFKDVNKRN